ncbi:flagellin lysine-N-methylase [Lacrimispora sp. JR3]|uniref:flagellin lysine-N-methylase n=1 Tax=Lacrimispora sinapis TaxID=3111456 RepID=UPI003747DD54
MQYTIPHYYNKFHCVAGACSDTCCAGWFIMIDDRSRRRYRTQKGEFGERLRRSIDWKNNSFKQYNRRCAFLNKDNLCDMYVEAGPEMLCKTCRDYPRHTEEYEGAREISLSLSCEEAARLILGTREKVRFLTKEDDREESYEYFDFLLYTKLMDSRDVLFSFLQNRSISCSLRMAMALGLTHDIQRRIRKDRLYKVDELLKRYAGEGAEKAIGAKLADRRITGPARFEKMLSWFGIFQKLEVLNADWPRYIGTLKKLLFDEGAAVYEDNRISFYRYLIEDEERKKQWELWSEQLLVYFVFTYYCGAVYDGQPYAKMKLAVVSTLLIQEMAQAVFKMREGRLDFSEFVHLSHRFSREVEHSDQNLNALDRIFCTDSRFGLDSILSLL